MSVSVRPVSIPARVAAADRPRNSGPLSVLPVPTLAPPAVGESVYFATGVVDSSGRVYDRAAVSELGWVRGDRLLVTVIEHSIVVHRRPDGVFAMTAKPYVVIPAVVRSRCGIRAGSRVLLAADPAQDVLVIHAPAAVAGMLSHCHSHLATSGGENR